MKGKEKTSQKIDGLIGIKKPNNVSSHSIVEKVRRIFKIKKVGHFGTLDPLAEGLLLIGMGNATKFFNFYIKKQKIYSGQIAFGYATSTYDSEGQPITEKKDIDLFNINLEQFLDQFKGKQLQTPPIYSAKKFKGRPLYKYARENKTEDIVIKPVEIEIYQLDGQIIDKTTLEFKATTSSGTYIRSLAHDMGEKLGVGAYLKKLIREAVGEFQLEQAFTLEQLEENVKNGNLANVVIPIESLLPEFPKIIVNQGGRESVLNGRSLLPADVLKILSPLSKNQTSIYFRLFDDEGKLLAIAKKDPKIIQFKPFIVFSN